MIKGTIESIGFGGEGILRQEGLVVFVPFTAPGDCITATLVTRKKNFARAKASQLDKRSSQRISAACPYFGTCGGCQLQHINPLAQLDAKRQFVIDALQRIGKIPLTYLPITAALQQWDYRQHIRLQLRKRGRGFQIGYVGFDPTDFVPVEQCPIFLPQKHQWRASLQPLLDNLSSSGIEEATLRLIKAEKGKLILAFSFSPILPSNNSITEKLFEESKDWQGIVMQAPNQIKQWGKVDCHIEMLSLKARFSPFGFVQNHPEQSVNLYQALLNILPSSSLQILDLYCGIGLTSLLFAREGKQVIGVESHPETVALAQENAQRNNLSSVHFIEGKAEGVGISLLKQNQPDTILCNPPRTGLDSTLIDALLITKPRYIFYISCMPSTLARDLYRFIQGGYTLTHIEAFDMFPQTTHVEVLVQLTKNRPLA